MSNLSPRENPPVTAATVVAAIMAVVTAFDIGHLTAEQATAVAGVLGIVAAVVAQRFTRPRSDYVEHAAHADPEAFHGQ